MRKVPSLLSVTQKEILLPRSLSLIFTIALLYILFSLFVLNNRLILDTLISATPISYKVTLFSTLFVGLFTAFAPIDSAIIVISSLLVGINLVLTARTLYVLEHQGKVRWSIGGATLVSLVTTGCSSCGFSLLSLLGLGTSLSFLPFHGLELHIASVILLLFSALYMLKKLRDGMYCKV